MYVLYFYGAQLRYVDIPLVKDNQAITDALPGCNGASHIMMVNKIQELVQKVDTQAMSVKELQGTVNEMQKIIESLQVQVATLVSKGEEVLRSGSIKVDEHMAA